MRCLPPPPVVVTLRPDCPFTLVHPPTRPPNCLCSQQLQQQLRRGKKLSAGPEKQLPGSISTTGLTSLLRSVWQQPGHWSVC